MKTIKFAPFIFILLTSCGGMDYGRSLPTTALTLPIESMKVCKPIDRTNNKIDIKQVSLDIKDPVDGKKFSFDFLDLNIREALLELSTQSGVPIVFDENVTGIISVSIKSKTFLESLKMIISAGPFDFKDQKHFYYVGLTDSSTPAWWRLAYTHNYKTKNLKPNELIKQINPRYKEFITGDESRGVITITASRRILKDIAVQLMMADIARKQILLNITISEVSSRGKRMMGGLLNSPLSTGTIGKLASLNTNGFYDMINTMKILKSKGELSIKASPTIIVQDGTPALFNSTVKQLNMTQYSKGKQIYIDSGIRLKIIPSVAENEDIMLKIDNLELGDIDSDRIYEHNLSTSIRVKKGESLLIGGMLMRKNKVQVTKIPILGSIPLIGWFFKHENKSKEMSEILFLIKPEVVCSNY